MPDFRTIDELAVAFGLDEAQATALSSYVELTLGWRRARMTALRTREDMVRILLGDSLALLDVRQLREREHAEWLDLGAGAGVPGIPLAVAIPTARLTLLESVAKKCDFLEAAVEAAGLAARARVVRARSEHYASVGASGRESFAVVLARAVAPLASLAELAAPLVAVDGVLLASKTSRALREEGAAGERAAMLCGLVAQPSVPLTRSPLGDSVCAPYLKVAPTPVRFPRREGLAVKRPLTG
jgi:16S rRNA (guanine527-N7)-methyltransferase